MNNNEYYNHIKIWFFDFRPELKPEDIAEISHKAYQELENQVKDLELPARNIFTNQFLKLNYLNSAYNLVKDVFKEKFPEEFEDYQKTPIFFEINEEVLVNCVHSGIFTSYDQILNEIKFNDENLRSNISQIIAKSIS
ncbi:hypothetical protein [Chryseobacterium oncorhynchi]|uniref:Uncharacterized protein n=1 Tax=Chryseobacterium oncorhynchi TaxID=741074 RepID=A0A316WFU5_9FLAO|nr:hypothetical protein [Chryseobacterium oncorhynchi]PWN59989.1 hypothetical protein C1638_020695 [Chryseobacterium oncorhynchi]